MNTHRRVWIVAVIFLAVGMSKTPYHARADAPLPNGAKAVWDTALEATPDDERILKVKRRFGL